MTVDRRMCIELDFSLLESTLCIVDDADFILCPRLCQAFKCTLKFVFHFLTSIRYVHYAKSALYTAYIQLQLYNNYYSALTLSSPPQTFQFLSISPSSISYLFHQLISVGQNELYHLSSISVYKIWFTFWSSDFFCRSFLSREACSCSVISSSSMLLTLSSSSLRESIWLCNSGTLCSMSFTIACIILWRQSLCICAWCLYSVISIVTVQFIPLSLLCNVTCIDVWLAVQLPSSQRQW